MNKEDKYWFFVMKAISAPDADDRNYFYDKELDSLFALSINKDEITPWYFNSVVVSQSIVEQLNKQISKLRNHDPSILTLQKLSYENKKGFFEGYLRKAQDSGFKSYLKSLIEDFTETSEFFFGIDYKGKDSSEVFKFDMARGKFLANKVGEIYGPIGISEKSFLIW